MMMMTHQQKKPPRQTQRVDFEKLKSREKLALCEKCEGREDTWVLKTRLIEKNTHNFFKPNFRKLQDDSKKVSLKIGSKVPQKLGPFFSFLAVQDSSIGLTMSVSQ